MRPGRSSGRSSVDRPGGAQGGPRDAYQLSTRSSRHRPALLQPVQARHSHARAGRAVPVHDAWGLRRTGKPPAFRTTMQNRAGKHARPGSTSGRKRDRCPNWILRGRGRGDLAHDRSWRAELPFDRRQTATGMWRQTAADCVTLGVSPLGPRLQSKGWSEGSTQQGRSPVEGLGSRPRRTPRAAVAGTVARAGTAATPVAGPSRPGGRRPRSCSLAVPSCPGFPTLRGSRPFRGSWRFHSSRVPGSSVVPGPSRVPRLPIGLHQVHNNRLGILFNNNRSSLNF
jgi:hypothetical protein